MMSCDSFGKTDVGKHQDCNKRKENCHIFSTPILTHTHPPPPPQPQINFKSWLGAHDVGNNCTITVQGTDFCIPRKGDVKKGNAFTSHKYLEKSALCYKLGIDILAGVDPGSLPCW